MIHAMPPIWGRVEQVFAIPLTAQKPDYGTLFEIIQEGGDALQGRFSLTFNLDFEVDFGLADAS